MVRATVRARGRPHPNPSEVMWRMTGSGWIYVVEDTKRAGSTAVAVAVTDLDEPVTNLEDRGITTGPIEVVGDGGRKANVVDSDGNVFIWIQVAASS